MSDELRFDKFQKCFVRGEKRISGLLPLILQRFYPTYSFTKATFNRPMTDETEYQQRKRKRMNPNRRKTGLDMGMKLDGEITKTVNHLNRFPNIPLQAFWNHKAMQRETRAPQWIKDECADLMEQTRAFWKEMQERKLTPIDSQVVVSKMHKGREIASAVDVMALDPTGGIIIIEVKCGFTGYYTACTKRRMNAPLQARTDCLANQHQIQLAATLELFRATFPDLKVKQSMIMHIEKSKVSCSALKPWATDVKEWTALLLETPPTEA